MDVQPVESKTSICNKEKAFKICLIGVVGVALPVIFAVGAAIGGSFVLQKASSLNKWRYVVGSLLIASSGISLVLVTAVFLGIFIKAKKTVPVEEVIDDGKQGISREQFLEDRKETAETLRAAQEVRLRAEEVLRAEEARLREEEHEKILRQVEMEKREREAEAYNFRLIQQFQKEIEEMDRKGFIDLKSILVKKICFKECGINFLNKLMQRVQSFSANSSFVTTNLSDEVSDEVIENLKEAVYFLQLLPGSRVALNVFYEEQVLKIIYIRIMAFKYVNIFIEKYGNRYEECADMRRNFYMDLLNFQKIINHIKNQYGPTCSLGQLAKKIQIDIGNIDHSLSLEREEELLNFKNIKFFNKVTEFYIRVFSESYDKILESYEMKRKFKLNKLGNQTLLRTFPNEARLPELIEILVHQCCSLKEDNYFNKENKYWIEFCKIILTKSVEQQKNQTNEYLYRILIGVANLYLVLNYISTIRDLNFLEISEICQLTTKGIKAINEENDYRMEEIDRKGDDGFFNICFEVLKEFFDSVFIVKHAEYGHNFNFERIQ